MNAGGNRRGHEIGIRVGSRNAVLERNSRLLNARRFLPSVCPGFCLHLSFGSPSVSQLEVSLSGATTVVINRRCEKLPGFCCAESHSCTWHLGPV